MKFNKKSLTWKLKKLPDFDDLYKEEYSIGPTFHFSDLRRYTEKAVKNKDNAKLKKIGELLNECWNNGDDDITNAIMVTYFEHLSGKVVKTIYKFINYELRKEAQDYLVAWKKFCTSIKK